MKRTAIYLLLSITTMLLGSFYEASAQSAKPSATAPDSEQSLQELVKEVRQLRREVQRLSVALYKGQVLVTRLRFQQDEVTRLSRELDEVRENLEEARAKQPDVRELIKSTEKDVAGGFKTERELNKMKADLENLIQIEQRLTERESQLTNELREARTKVANIERQLKELESEMAGK